ncbi:hypothetical protein FQZ97_526110 [compost metagenome]
MPALFVAGQLGADFALALAQLAHPLAQCLPLRLQPLAVQFALRRRLEPFGLVAGIGQQGLGIAQLAGQALLQVLQGGALGFVQLCGEESRLVREGAGGQTPTPEVQLHLQLVPGFLHPQVLALLGALETVQPLLGGVQLGLHRRQGGLRIVHLRQRCLPGVAGGLPAALPEAGLFTGDAQCVLLIAQLAVQLLAGGLVLLPLLPFGIPLGQPGVARLRQGMTQLRQAGGQLLAGLLLLAGQLVETLGIGQFLLAQAGLVLLQQGKLAAAVMQGLVALLAPLAGGGQGSLEPIQPSQSLLQRLQAPGMVLLLGLQGGEVRQLQIEGLAQLAPALDALALLGFTRLQGFVELIDLRLQAGQAAAQGFTLAAHLVLGSLARLQSLLGGGQVEGLVFGYCRVFVRAAQGAGLARLQGGAVGLQLLDALLLFEELFLVGDLLLELAEAAAQGIALLGERFLLVLQGLQLFAGARLPFRQLPALLGQLLQALQLAAALQQLLPLLAQGGVVLPGQELIETALGIGLRLPGPAMLGPGVVQGAAGLVQALFQFDALALQLGLGTLQAGKLFLAPGQHAEFGPPGAQVLAQAGPLWMFSQAPLQGFTLGLEAVQGRLAGLCPLFAQLCALPELVEDALGEVLQVVAGDPQFAFTLVQLLLRPLPVAMQRQQLAGRLAGRQTGKLRLCLFQGCARCLALPFGGLLAGQCLVQFVAPLALALQVGLARLQLLFFACQGCGFLQQGGAGLVIQEFHAFGTGAQLVQPCLHLAGAFEHPLGDASVDFSAGQFLQQLRALVGVGLEEGGKAALGQQHGLGETLEVEAAQAFGEPELVVDLVGEDFPVQHAGQLHLGRLQAAVGLVTGAALAPEGAVGHALHFELHLRQAVGGVPGHQLVDAGGHRTHARRAVVEGQADGIEQGGLAGAGGAGDGEQAVAGEGFAGEVDLPLALQRVEVLQAQAEDLHAGSSRSSASTSRCSPWRPRRRSSSSSSLARRLSNTSSGFSSSRVSRASRASPGWAPPRSRRMRSTSTGRPSQRLARRACRSFR